MRVKLRLFATYRDYLPPENDGNTIEFEVPSGTHIGDLMSMFDIPIGQESVILLNGITAGLDDTFNEGDIISAFPAMAGG
jgi:molybdopterin converting factor small subunit